MKLPGSRLIPCRNQIVPDKTKRLPTMFSVILIPGSLSSCISRDDFARSSGGRIRLYRRLIFGIVLFCVSLPAGLLADDWPGPQTREVFSQNRQYFVRITPGESWGETWGFAGTKIGRHAQAAFFREQSDKGYRLERTIELLNPVALVDVFVSNGGELVTLDNWHNRGYGAVLVLYHADGELIKVYKLADL